MSRNPITKAKNLVVGKYFRTWLTLTNKILKHRVESLVARGVEASKIVDAYIYSSQRLNELLGKYAARKDVTLEQKKDILGFLISSINRNIDSLAEFDLHGLSIEKGQQQKVLKTYLDIEQNLYTVIKDIEGVNAVADPKQASEVLAKHLENFQNSVYLLLSTQKINNEQLESKEDKFKINLGDGFDELVNADEKTFQNSKLNKNVQVSVVYPMRDRDPERLIMSVKSLALYSSIGFEVIAVDYGSKEKQAGVLKTIASKYGIKLIRTETQGQPWSRSKALNIGIKNATSDVIVTTDMDMVFMDDILGTAYSQLVAGNVIHCRPWWLTETGNIADAWLGDKNQLGGFQMIYKDEITKLSGFNENISYWGAEDLELDKRMFRSGINTIWLDEKVKMYHMWHPTDYGVYDLRPLSSWFDSNRELMAAQNSGEYHNPDFGKVLERTDRPVLMEVTKKNREHVIEVDQNYPATLDNLVGIGRRHKALYLNFGPRIFADTRNYSPALVNMDKHLSIYGLELKVKKTTNFDFFYLSLPELEKGGMVDYFIEDDFSGAYILFK